MPSLAIASASCWSRSKSRVCRRACETRTTCRVPTNRWVTGVGAAAERETDTGTPLAVVGLEVRAPTVGREWKLSRVGDRGGTNSTPTDTRRLLFETERDVQRFFGEVKECR